MFFFKKKVYTMEQDYIEYFKALPSVILYTDDHEYRNAIRKTFRFDPKEKYNYNGIIQDFESLDDITKDEVFLDSKSITTSMDCLYEHTIIEPHFQELYEKSAGRMFSTDPQIGQAVLCAYDTFMLYYSAVWHFLHGGVSALLNCPEYKKLVSYFDKRL